MIVKKMIIYKKEEDPSRRPIDYIKVPLRSVQVHDSFIGIDKRGKPIASEFMRLAQDLEPWENNLVIDVLNV